MLERLLPTLIVASAVGAGLMAGLLFAFSNFVMKSLAQIPAEHGMYAMQRINIEIINPVFLLVFVGTAVMSVALFVGALLGSDTPARLWLIAGAVFYLLGVIGITAAFNIPLNNFIASLPASAAESSWPNYVTSWLRWNHVRTAFAVAASASFVVGALRLTNGPAS
jgi:uncharacterized membrane protein